MSYPYIALIPLFCCLIDIYINCNFDQIRLIGVEEKRYICKSILRQQVTQV